MTVTPNAGPTPKEPEATTSRTRSDIQKRLQTLECWRLVTLSNVWVRPGRARGSHRTIDAVCEECGKSSTFRTSQGGTVQDCPLHQKHIDVPDPDDESNQDFGTAEEVQQQVSLAAREAALPRHSLWPWRRARSDHFA